MIDADESPTPLHTAVIMFLPLQPPIALLLIHFTSEWNERIYGASPRPHLYASGLIHIQRMLRRFYFRLSTAL